MQVTSGNYLCEGYERGAGNELDFRFRWVVPKLPTTVLTLLPTLSLT